MLVKTFQAGDMSEALKLVKAELGPDALILSSKKERRKGIFGLFSKPVVEVTAALEVRPRQVPNPYREQEEQKRQLSAGEELQNSMFAPLARELRDLRERVEQLSKKEAAAPVAVEAALPEPPAAEPARQLNGDFIPDSISRQQLEEMKSYLFRTRGVDGDEKPVPPASVHEASATEKQSAAVDAEAKNSLRVIIEELHEKGVEKSAIRSLLDRIKPAIKRTGKVEALKTVLPEAFSGVIKCAGPLELRKNGPKILALAGPTGVGKTTTIAKLAALYALNMGHRVAMITIDNFRVGAIEQLKTYSRIMGVPLETATTPAELEAAIELHSDKELILIDTAGRSPKDHGKIDELKGFLESRFAIEVHLCLAATTRDKEMREIVNRYSVLPIKKLIFTKLDESETFGCIVNVHLRDKFQLSYFTNGQKVPEDLEVATPEKLAALVLGESRA